MQTVCDSSSKGQSPSPSSETDNGPNYPIILRWNCHSHQPALRLAILNRTSGEKLIIWAFSPMTLALQPSVVNPRECVWVSYYN